jgi:hypothetical protein
MIKKRFIWEAITIQFNRRSALAPWSRPPLSADFDFLKKVSLPTDLEASRERFATCRR